MTHYDEHTLTSYVLGLEPPEASRAAIASHLGECRGCSDLVERLEDLYAGVQRELESSPPGGVDETAELMRIRGEGVSRLDPRGGDMQPAGAPIGRRVMRYIYRHPVASGAAVIVAGLLVVLSVQPLVEKMGAATAGRPTSFRYNATGTEIEVSNRNAVRLWGFPVAQDLIYRGEEVPLEALRTKIAQIGRNGTLEIVTASPFTEGNRTVLNTLRLFSETGSLLKDVQLGRRLTFQGGEYPLYFHLATVAILNMGKDRPPEIIATACNYRSPFGTYRLNAEGEILGEYWHCGWLSGVIPTRLEGIDHDVIVLCGANDVNDKADSGFACIAVLDPLKISGVTEGTGSRGFGFPPSRAELFYIKAVLPRIPMSPDSNLGRETFYMIPKVGNDGSLIFHCCYRNVDKTPLVSFSFNNRMLLQGAFLDDHSREVLRGKYLADHTAGAIDRFLEEAKAGVSYWDGADWVRNPTQVKHPLTLPMP